MDLYELMPGRVTSLPEHELNRVSWIIERPPRSQGSSTVTGIGLEKEEQKEITRNVGTW